MWLEEKKRKQANPFKYWKNEEYVESKITQAKVTFSKRRN